MALVQFYDVTPEQFKNLTTKDESALYFLSNGQLYKGGQLIGNNIELITDSFPSTGVKGILYIKPSTGESKYWDGTQFLDFTKEITTLINAASTDEEIPTAAAVRTYASSVATDKANAAQSNAETNANKYTDSVKTVLQALINKKAPSADGVSADSALKLTTSAGDVNKPVYFKDGAPVGINYTINKTVPSDAKFTDTTYENATQSAAGLMSAEDKKRLDGLTSGDKNQNAFSKVVVGSSTIEAETTTDTLTIAAGTNVTLTPDVSTDKITIAAKDTTYTKGAGINISDANVISNAGVRSISSGSTNGTISVNTNGTTADVAVKGLGSAAYATKGGANGVAELDANGKVLTSQLPSYVDDVVEYSGLANFPTTGTTGIIYVDTATNKTYRWSGTKYVEISASLTLGNTSSTAFRGDYGHTLYSNLNVSKGSDTKPIYLKDGVPTEVASEYVTLDTAQTITGNKIFTGVFDFSNTTGKLSSHYYHRLYSDNHVYVHYYDTDTTDFSKTTTATFRVSDATNKTFKALQFSGDGNFKWDNSQVLTEHNYGSYIRTLPYLATTQVFSPVAGRDVNLTAGTSRLYANALVISNPTTANDVGWVRVTGTGESDTVLELATGDDGGGSTCESIVARQYNTSNEVARQAVLLASDGASYFPVSVSAPSFIGSLNGNASSSTTASVAAKLGQGGATSAAMTFNWFGQSGQPTWLWGGNNGTDMYVYNPSNFNVATAITSTALTVNNTESKDVGRLQFLQTSGNSTLMPDTDWWSLVRTQHAGYSNGYWQEMAYSFHSDTIKFRRNVNGTLNAWVTLLHSGNYSSYALPLTGGTMTGNIVVPYDKGIIQHQRSDSNYTSALCWYKGGTSQASYDPQIGQHNTGGDGPGSISILPYPTESNPWEGAVGLFIQKGAMKLDGVPVLTAAGFTMNNSAVIKFPASAGSISVNDPMSITYGRIASYGTLCINGDTDGSTNESVIITAGRGHSSSASDGLSVGYSSLTWQGNSVVTVAGATMAGKITGSTAQGSWISCTRNGAFRLETAAIGDTASSVLSMKTSSGAWSITNLAGSNSLFFCFGTDTNYSNGNNTTTNIEFSGGTIIASLSGNASTATTASNLSGFVNTTTSGTAIDSAVTNGHYYVTETSGIYSQYDGSAFVQAYNSAWVSQIYQDYRTGQIALRGKNNGTWQAWRKVLDSSNYTSWVIPKTGGTFSGSIFTAHSTGGETQVGVTHKTGHLYLYGNNSYGTRGIWDSKKGEIISVTDTTTTFTGSLSGNATTATKLQTARTINGTSFDGSANITTANWGTARTITIGDTGKSVNGSGNVSWSINEIGALALNGSNYYVQLTGGNGNTFGWREVLSYTCGAWDNPRIVLSINSRHQGSGILSIGFSTYDPISSYVYDIRYYGTNCQSVTSGAWRAFYNTSTGVFKLYWCYSDYSPCNVTVLSKAAFGNPSNGTWYETLPFSGTELSVKINDAQTADLTTYVKDSYDGNNINITYGKSGQSSTSWLASWNGYELGSISPANITAGKVTQLATARNIFGKSFNGTADVAGQGLFYGTYTSTASNRYLNSGLQIRENGLVDNAQSDIGYAPTIGFHWSGHIAATLAFNSDGIFYFRKQDGTSRATIDANVNGHASSATTANNVASTGFGASCFTYFQTSNSFAGSDASWAGYLISNHGAGATYFNQILRMPFWSAAPQYSYMSNGTQSEWYTLHSTGNSSKAASYSSGLSIGTVKMADSTSTYYVPYATASQAGVVSTAAQTFAGVKTFNNGLASNGNISLANGTYIMGKNSAGTECRILTITSSGNIGMNTGFIGNLNLYGYAEQEFEPGFSDGPRAYAVNLSMHNATTANNVNLFSVGGNTTYGNITVATSNNYYYSVVRSLGIYNRTTTSAANVFISSTGGVLMRSTSASKYKLNIKKIEQPDSYYYNTLKLSPKQWNDKGSVEAYANYLTRSINNDKIKEDEEEKDFLNNVDITPVYGLVAEDVEKAGLEKYCVYAYDEETQKNEIEGIQYDRLWIPLIPVVRDIVLSMQKILPVIIPSIRDEETLAEVLNLLNKFNSFNEADVID